MCWGCDAVEVSEALSTLLSLDLILGSTSCSRRGGPRLTVRVVVGAEEEPPVDLLDGSLTVRQVGAESTEPLGAEPRQSLKKLYIASGPCRDRGWTR